MHSPSSINTYKQCPRRYYYQYIKKMKMLPSIHLSRGNIIHSVLEKFFDMELTGINLKNFELSCRKRLQALLKYYWEKNPELKGLGLSNDQMRFYFEESMFMLMNWFNKFNEKIKQSREQNIQDAFKKLVPEREHFIQSEELAVRGFIDAIETSEGQIKLMDYKTSKTFELSEEYHRQLAIYALLYTVNYGRPPQKVGIYFLKDPDKHEHFLNVDGELLKFAKTEIEFMHLNTQSEDIKDYPKKPSFLCKFSSGQCDFYEACSEK